MCIPGGRPWPLAVTREVIGWTKVDEIQPQNGEYTLYEASAAYKDEGNLRGNDYIYVYRTNDTSITASAG